MVSRDGAVDLTRAGGEGIASFRALDILYAGAHQEADRNRAAAFLADVQMPGGHAVRLEVEHADGLAFDIVIFVPAHQSAQVRAVCRGERQPCRAAFGWRPKNKQSGSNECGAIGFVCGVAVLPTGTQPNLATSSRPFSGRRPSACPQF